MDGRYSCTSIKLDCARRSTGITYIRSKPLRAAFAGRRRCDGKFWMFFVFLFFLSVFLVEESEGEGGGGGGCVEWSGPGLCYGGLV